MSPARAKIWHTSGDLRSSPVRGQETRAQPRLNNISILRQTTRNLGPVAAIAAIWHDVGSLAAFRAAPHAHFLLQPSKTGLPMPAFPEIAKIKFEGPKSKNPLTFHWYDENEVVEGKKMKDHFRFSVAYWHTFRGTGSDPFGPGTMSRPWEGPTDNVENACNRARVAFEF